MLTHFGWHSGITISRQVYQKTAISQLIIIYMLSAPGRFADKGKAAALGQGIDCARLACIGPPGKSNFYYSIRCREIRQPVNGGIECCALKNRHTINLTTAF